VAGTDGLKAVLNRRYRAPATITIDEPTGKVFFNAGQPAKNNEAATILPAKTASQPN
jgi:hypothetical protein